MKDLFKTMPEFANAHDLKRCVVNGREFFCTDERIKHEDMPQGLYKADVRSSDTDDDKWSTIEPSVWVNHCATLVSDEPFNFEQPYIIVDTYDVEY